MFKYTKKQTKDETVTYEGNYGFDEKKVVHYEQTEEGLFIILDSMYEQDIPSRKPKYRNINGKRTLVDYEITLEKTLAPITVMLTNPVEIEQFLKLK